MPCCYVCLRYVVIAELPSATQVAYLVQDRVCIPYLQHRNSSQGKHSLSIPALRVEHSNVYVHFQNAH